MKTRVFEFLLFFFVFISVSKAENEPSIIPKPYDAKIIGGSCSLEKGLRFVSPDASILNSIKLFSGYCAMYFEVKSDVSQTENKDAVNVLIKKIPSAEKGDYSIKINAERIIIEGDETGIFYAFQSIKQIIKKNKNGIVSIPCMEIVDKPRFSWRGMHLDVCRHFMSKDEVKKYIDYLAMYKMNVFHWHLTDDQGWRIEIKRYPKLTQIGSWRKGTLIGAYSYTGQKFDTIRHGGFYTQDDVKEIVQYAAQRYITIVPEIEMPGHALAALTAYPEYSCSGGPFEVAKLWGVFDDVFCCKDSTFIFLNNILDEIIDLFPGVYIHIGGDECPKIRWKTCEKCQQIKARENLSDEHELQSYFIGKIENYVNKKGRKIIGWDEILEGGLAQNAAVMSWRGTEGGIKAAKEKHYVVMSPGSHCYFDHYQGSPNAEPLAIGGYTTVEKVYSFEPVPSELSKEFRSYILGAQGNVWTEYIHGFKEVEYMVFPRIAALSEVLWSKNERNWDEFKNRLIQHFNFLDLLKINYSKALFEINSEVFPSLQGVLLKLSSSLPNGEIRFTTDGTIPNANSEKFVTDIEIHSSKTIKAAAFRDKVCQSSIWEQHFQINKASGKSVLLSEMPHENYCSGGKQTLTDGITGRIPWYGKEWLGFSGKDMIAVVDLGKNDTITSIGVDVLKAEGSWIYYPSEVYVMLSKNGNDFFEAGHLDAPQIEANGRIQKITFSPLVARYVKIHLKNAGIIPEGNPGAGTKAWLFVGEIMVD